MAELCEPNEAAQGETFPGRMIFPKRVHTKGFTQEALKAGVGCSFVWVRKVSLWCGAAFRWLSWILVKRSSKFSGMSLQCLSWDFDQGPVLFSGACMSQLLWVSGLGRFLNKDLVRSAPAAGSFQTILRASLKALGVLA